MTLNLTKVSTVVYLTMAFSFVIPSQLLYLLVLVFFLCFNHYIQLARGAAEPFNPISGANFYHECETLIKRELEVLTDSDLENEPKLTRVTHAKVGSGSSVFFPEKKLEPENKLFVWKSKNATYLEDVIIIGVNERSASADFTPFGWMSGTFITLKIVDPSLTKKKYNPDDDPAVDYYAFVAYVRKDLHKNKEIELEWDRFSPRVVKNLLRRESTLEAAEQFTVETFLCAYGSCACAACQCENEQEDDQDEAGPQTAKRKTNKKRNIATSALNRKRRKKYGLATAIALSSKGKTHSKGVGKGKSSSRAGSISKSNTAVAESTTNQGRSAAFASGAKSTLAESSSRTGDTKSYSKAKKGYAQSAAQSYGGRVEASAAKTGESGEYNYYDDDGDNAANEDIDAKSLIRDTNLAFAEAYNRSEKLKGPTRNAGFRDDVCMKEYILEMNLTLVEWKTLVTKGNASAESGGVFKRYHKDPIFLFKNLLRYGIDVELGVNTSILITSVIPGYAAPRESCCDLRINPSSTVGNFLQTFKQDCNSDLETQVARLEASSNDANFANILQTKKLSLYQLRDLIPMILLKHFRNSTIRKSVWNVSALFENNISEEIKTVVAITVNAAQYSAQEGHFHKVKILKGLALNVRTVFTGIMLETKKCMKEKRLCDEDYLIKLANEKRLILGLFYFLKFADSRLAYFRNKNPMVLFVEFLKLHDASLETLGHCKSRRVILRAKSKNATKIDNFNIN